MDIQRNFRISSELLTDDYIQYLFKWHSDNYRIISRLIEPEIYLILHFQPNIQLQHNFNHTELITLVFHPMGRIFGQFLFKSTFERRYTYFQKPDFFNFGSVSGQVFLCCFHIDQLLWADDGYWNVLFDENRAGGISS